MLETIISQGLPLLMSVIVGVASAFMTSRITIARLEERVANLERHNIKCGDIHKMFADRVQDVDKRLASLDTFAKDSRDAITEMRNDIKMLLKTH